MAAPVGELRVETPPGGWTVDALLALPPGRLAGGVVELVDGLVLVSPLARLEHQRLVGRLWGRLTSGAGAGLEVLPGVNLVLGNRNNRLLIPDLVVSSAPGLEGVSLTEKEVVLVVEIESPSTRVHDRILKKALYAEALISYYLLIDPEQESATLFALADGEYAPHTKSEGGVLSLTEPFTAEVDLRG
ncbi:Uma2 family endonuclease [Amycolatopsis panacis]|uniref:Uma2 family endonuclease n=1 Tax=Amycolatopsis panacis TaxID=2340917 RepID=A0A419I885_9PSEU|nr:Uma2 family endonuclease [Amycolatopsis panacis]RJQ88155.1 Uma2 family endonuclease [Amycolatopsis panacis]